METPNYKESIVSGTTYQRAGRVVAENPRGGTPSLLFVEEEAVTLGEQTITRICDNISVQFDPANPLHLAAYEAIAAIYVEEREKRDALAAQEVA